MLVMLILALGVAGLGIAAFFARQVLSVSIDGGADSPEQAQKLRFIHQSIAKGAMAFLFQEYRYMAVFMAVFAVLITVLIDDPHTADVSEGFYTAIAFICGGLISIAAGFSGMKIATANNGANTNPSVAGQNFCSVAW